MRLPTSVLLIGLAGAALAASEAAEVYIFPEPEHPSSAVTPALTPEVARLVIAQRLGISQYHGLSDGRDSAQSIINTIKYINAFGGQQAAFFADDVQFDGRPHLVVMLEGASSKILQPLRELLQSNKPAFQISKPPSKKANTQLVSDMIAQNPRARHRQSCPLIDEVNPLVRDCWAGRSKIMHLDVQSDPALMNEFTNYLQDVLKLVKSGGMDLLLVIFPDSSRDSAATYGTYDMPHRSDKRQIEEEPLELPSMLPDTLPVNALNGSSPKKHTPHIFPSCYSSNETCQTATNNCSGHGRCIAKSKSNSPGGSCYTCHCIPSINIHKAVDGTELSRTTHWGGPACTKEDVSSQFWLLAGFSIILISLVSWAIGMMFSIGNEKLPGVIGAGVSGPKAR